MNTIQHGMYAKRVKTPAQNTSDVTSGIPVYIGTAPVHRLENVSAAVNTPVICYTKEDCEKKLGYHSDFEKYTLCQTMYMHFMREDLDTAIAPVVFINVLDPSVHKKKMEDMTVPVTKRIAVIPNSYAVLSSLKVSAGEEELEKGKDYIVSLNGDFPSITLLLAGKASDAAEITVTGEQVDPDQITSDTVIGGYDAETGAESGLEAIRKIYPLLNVTAAIIAAPGFSHDPVVAAVMQAKCENINGTFTADCVIDLDTSNCKKYEDVPAQKETLGLLSKHAYVVWPMVKKDGKVLYGSAAVCATVEETDAASGNLPNVSPSNKLAHIDAACLADGTTVLLDQAQANAVNAYGVATFLNADGFRVWGNYSAAYPESTELDEKYWSVNRFFTWKGNHFVQKYMKRIDSVNNVRAIEALVDEENMECNSYVSAGVCAGASVEFRRSDHTNEDIMCGNIKIHMFLAPYLPMESITSVMEFDLSALINEFAGGEVA